MTAKLSDAKAERLFAEYLRHTDLAATYRADGKNNGAAKQETAARQTLASLRMFGWDVVDGALRPKE